MLQRQALVDTETLLVMVPQVTQGRQRQAAGRAHGREASGAPGGPESTRAILADAGYFSEANVDACEAAGIEPLMAIQRDEHHPHFERFSEPPKRPAEATLVQRMTHRLKTGAGKAAHALRKSTVEPVFGIIQSVMGFRQFLTRGLANVQGEWTLVCLAWNLKRTYCVRSKGKPEKTASFEITVSFNGCPSEAVSTKCRG